MERNKVVLVDINDNSISEMDKLLAHEQGHLHRAFSVFIFDDNYFCNKGQSISIMVVVYGPTLVVRIRSGAKM